MRNVRYFQIERFFQLHAIALHSRNQKQNFGSEDGIHYRDSKT